MTPSNANTSGLVHVGEASSMPGSSGFTMAAFKASDVPVGTPLVTAASAQARIDEERALFKSLMVRKNFYKENMLAAEDRATAAEARADRLAKALERIALSEWNDGKSCLKAVTVSDFARAALQQETQP